MATNGTPTSYRVHGLDCAEEVAALKQEVGPLVGGGDKLAFDVLTGRMMVLKNAEPVSVEEILASPEVFDPLTRYQCCPPTCGAAAAILASDEFVKKHGIDKPVYIAGQAMTTDFQSTFDEHSMIKAIGYEQAGFHWKKSKIDVLLHGQSADIGRGVDSAEGANT